MLRTAQTRSPKHRGGRYAIVASRYNQRYVDGMLRGARAFLRTVGADAVTVVRVPGAFEIPVVAAHLARQPSPAYAAVICLGVILRGETSHADHIGQAVSLALAQIQVQYGVPIIHEVLVFANADQARVRCLDPRHNRGREAAQTAVAMAGVMAKLANHRGN